MTKVVALVQARTGSSRLPAKVLEPIGGRPLVLAIADRLRRARRVDAVALSTSDDAGDDRLAEIAAADGLAVSRGPVDDIVGRLARAAAATGADVLVRVWGDCPFVAPEVVDGAVDLLDAAGLDFVTNAVISGRTYPPGLDVEVYRAGLLVDMDRDVRDPRQREFPVEYVRGTGRRWQVMHYGSDLSKLHLTVDYPEDLEAARAIYDALAAGGRGPGLDDLIALLRGAPELLGRFAQGERNIEYKAYLDSLGGGARS